MTACKEDAWEMAQEDCGAKTKLFIGSESEVRKWYKSRQKFVEVIKAWEDGKTIQYYYDPDEEWVDIEVIPHWNVNTKYRVKLNGLVWTDLKVGDILVAKYACGWELKEMVIGIDSRPNTMSHICLGTNWIDDNSLKEWRKAE